MEKVRFGVLGCARVFERRMAPALKSAGNATLHAVASRSQEKATATAEKHGAARAYGSYDALLADPDLDAIYIPLPNDQHAEWTVKALAAGKHVLCDKPLALSVAEAEWMAGEALASGLRLMEGFMYRHHPQHQKVFEVLRSGAIGEPVHFRGIFTYPATADHAGIRWNPAQGGGAFLDVGVYPLNAARWLFGSEPTEAKVIAVRDPSTGVDIHTAALLAFPESRTASIIGGFDQAFTSRYEPVICFALEALRGQANRGQAQLARMGEPGGLGLVGDYHRDLGVETYRRRYWPRWRRNSSRVRRGECRSAA